MAAHSLDRQRRRIAVLAFVVAGVIVAFWAAWYGHRSLVAADTTAEYIAFENAFPLADGWLALLLVLSGLGLLRRWAATPYLLVASAAAGLYLFGMDVLYDVEHGIWGRGGNGLVELGINLATLVLSVTVGRFAWVHRAELAGDGSAPR